MKRGIKRAATIAFVFIVLGSALFSAGITGVSAMAAGRDDDVTREINRQTENERLADEADGGEAKDRLLNKEIGQEKNQVPDKDVGDKEKGQMMDKNAEGKAKGQTVGVNAGNSETNQVTDEEIELQYDAGAEEKEQIIVEILGIDKENLMEFGADMVTREEALAMLPDSTDARLGSGEIVRIGIKWNYECCSSKTERYRLALDSEKYALGISGEELPYVDILFDGINTLEAYSPNTSSVVKLDKSLGCKEDVVAYLETHQSTYLGTPYSSLGTGLTISNCMIPGKNGNMNCTGFVAHVLKACGANLDKIPQRLPGHYLNASNWNDYAHNYNVQSYRYDSIAEALRSGKLEKGDIIYFEPRLWKAGEDCHIGFFWGDTSSQNRFWHSDYKGNRISEIVAKTSNSYVYLFKINHEPETGYLKLHKSSSFPQLTSDNSCYSLEGAVYTIYNTNKNGALGGKINELRTDKNGDTPVIELELGTYYIKETAAPSGFERDEKIYLVEVTAAATKTNPVLVQVEDIPESNPSGIAITKIVDGELMSDAPTLAGTEFTIKYYDGYYTEENLPDSANRTWVIRIRESASGVYRAELTDDYLVKELSDELYYDGTIPVLPYGTITIQETRPAAGYTLKGYLADGKGDKVAVDGEVYVSQITKGANGVFLAGGNEYTSADQPITGSIRIRKYDADGTSPLRGVTFEIADSGGNVVATATTDKNGEIVFEHLRPDVYTIAEIKTTQGHTLLKDTITAEIPMRVTEKEIEDNKIDKNQCIYDKNEDIYYIYDLTYEISNDIALDMPMTGGTYTIWTWLPMVGGLILLTFVSILVRGKKNRIY